MVSGRAEAGTALSRITGSARSQRPSAMKSPAKLRAAPGLSDTGSPARLAVARRASESKRALRLSLRAGRVGQIGSACAEAVEERAVAARQARRDRMRGAMPPV